MAGINFSTLILNNLRVGSVIYTHCDFCTPPKNKYLLVASMQPNFLVLIINTQIHQFFINNGTDKFHVRIPVADHNFLQHDSFTNCIEAHTAFQLDDCKTEMLTNYNNFHRGWLTDNCLNEVLTAVQNQTLMRRKHKNEIISSLNARLFPDQ